MAGTSHLLIAGMTSGLAYHRHQRHDRCYCVGRRVAGCAV